MKKLRLIIADDHAVLRNALRVLLSQQEDFEVVAEAGNETEALEAIEKHAVDVLILDMNMPPGMAPHRKSGFQGQARVGYRRVNDV